MSKIFRKHSSISCFYCQEPVNPLPRNPRSFRCPNCDCWNRYDSRGEITSDEPAMYDENLNARSFARRASPRKDRLPTMYGSGLFCHTCQTNQMLLANLLSSYLPPPEDPEYEQRAHTLPEYRRSVEMRYPPVCTDCAPAVEEEIRKRDHMARTSALGGFLRASNPVASRVTRTQRDKDKLEREIAMWKVRGALWGSCLLLTVGVHIAVVSGYSIPPIPNNIKPVMPTLALASLLWTAWDPTYASLRRAQFQGRAIRQRGKKEYNFLQVVAWLFRCLTSLALAVSWYIPAYDKVHIWDDPRSSRARRYSSISLAIEIFVLLRSFMVLRLERPPPVRLTTDRSKSTESLSPLISPPASRSTTPAIDSDLLAPLTLSSKPVVVPSRPATGPKSIFGRPSLPTAPPTELFSASASNTTMEMDEDDDDLSSSAKDPDAMDWSPIHPSSSRNNNSHMRNGPQSHKQNGDGMWLRPQRFFAPEEPTGLENLFTNTIRLVDDEPSSRRGGNPDSASKSQMWEQFLRIARRWAWVSALCLIPIAGVAYKAWNRSRITEHAGS